MQGPNPHAQVELWHHSGVVVCVVVAVVVAVVLTVVLCVLVAVVVSVGLAAQKVSRPKK